MGEGPAIIEAVLPRTSALVRKAAGERRPQLLAANIDVVFIVTAPDRDFNLPRLERYLALVQESGAAPVIIINESDLTNDVIGTTGQIAAIAPGVPIHAVSARGRDGMGDLERYFVRPGLLTNGPVSGKYRVLSKPSAWRNGMISRADVADFIVKRIEAGALKCEKPVVIHFPL